MAYIKQKELEASEPNFKIVQEIMLSEKETPKLRNAHSKYPSFTAKVDIKWTKQYGRHVVPNDIIKPGEVIAVDTAIVGILSPEKYSTNCLHCMASLVRIIPCPTCTMVRFCSSQCQNKAMQSYHGIECKLGLGDLYQRVG